MADGPLVEQEIWQHYQQAYPGQVQVLGPDVGDGTAAQLAGFRVNAGNPSFPLLQTCADGSASSDTMLLKLYVQRDNYVIINKQGIIRYHAADFWPYGNRYHLNELSGTIDSLVTNLAGVDHPRARAFGLSAAPNPFRGRTVVELTNPASAPAHARVTVLDLGGRVVATLWDGPASSGVTRVAWDGRATSGATLAPGVYVVHAEIAGRRLTRMLVHIR